MVLLKQLSVFIKIYQQLSYWRPKKYNNLKTSNNKFINFMDIYQNMVSSAQKEEESDRNFAYVHERGEQKDLGKCYWYENQTDEGEYIQSDLPEDTDEEEARLSRTLQIKSNLANSILNNSIPDIKAHENCIYFANVPISLKKQILFKLFHEKVQGLVQISLYQAGQGQFKVKGIESTKQLMSLNGFQIRGMNISLQIKQPKKKFPFQNFKQNRVQQKVQMKSKGCRVNSKRRCSRPQKKKSDIQMVDDFGVYEINYQIFETCKAFKSWLKAQSINDNHFRNFERKSRGSGEKIFLEMKRSEVSKLKSKQYKGQLVIFTRI